MMLAKAVEATKSMIIRTGRFTLVAPFNQPELTVNSIVNLIIQTMYAIGIVMTVINLVFTGIRYIVAGGDVKKIEAACKSFANVIIGFLIIILTFAIIKLIAVFFGVNADQMFDILPESIN